MKLLIIGEVRFKELEDYVRKSLFFYRGRKNRKKPALRTASKKADHKINRDYSRQSYEAYEASKIWATRQSLLWRWRRTYQWFNEFSESYEMQ